MKEEVLKHTFEDEIIFSLQHQRNNWAKIAVGCVGLAILSVGTLIAILPLKETKPFVVMVDKTTGEAEKLVQVRAATLDEKEAVLQAELVSYISDRETYDISDNATRVPDVVMRSKEQAEQSMTALWTADNPQYPPTIYGKDARVIVKIKSISLSPIGSAKGQSLARVRFTKIREDKHGEKPVERSYIATVGYSFSPLVERSLEVVWKNPLGFTVKAYRVDAETVQ
jgi:type IV secretion system protein VirB8